MPYIDPNVFNRFNQLSGLGALAGKSSRKLLAQGQAAYAAADAALKRMTTLQSQLDSAVGQISSLISNAQQQIEIVKAAIDAAGDSSSYNLLTRLDAPTTKLSDIQATLDDIGTIPSYPTAPSDDFASGENEKIVAAANALTAAVGKVRPLGAAVTGVISQVKSVAAQVQANITRAQQAAASAQAAQARAEAQAQAAQTRADAQAQAIIDRQNAADQAAQMRELQKQQMQAQADAQAAAIQQQLAMAPLLAQQQQQAQAQAQSDAAIAAQQQAAIAAQQQQAQQPQVYYGQPQTAASANYAELPGGYYNPGQQSYQAAPQPTTLPSGWTAQEAAARQSQQQGAAPDAGFEGSWYKPGFELFGMNGMGSRRGGMGALPTPEQLNNLLKAAAPLIPTAPAPPPPETNATDVATGAFGTLALGAAAFFLAPKVIDAAKKLLGGKAKKTSKRKK